MSKIIGIDLGTTHSLVASVRHGLPECLPDEQGRVILPSVVRYLEGGRRQIGFEALAAQVEQVAVRRAPVFSFAGGSVPDRALHRLWRDLEDKVQGADAAMAESEVLVLRQSMLA